MKTKKAGHNHSSQIHQHSSKGAKLPTHARVSDYKGNTEKAHLENDAISPTANIDDFAPPPEYHDEHEAPADRPAMPSKKPMIHDPTERPEKHGEVSMQGELGHETTGHGDQTE